MNKEQLRSILSDKYDLASWRQVLTEVFGATGLFQQPKPITLPANDLAESSSELGSFKTSDDRLVGLYQIDLKDNVRIGQNRVGLRKLLRNIYTTLMPHLLYLSRMTNGGSRLYLKFGSGILKQTR